MSISRKNVGGIDRYGRMILGAFLLAFGFGGLVGIQGVPIEGIVGGVVGVVGLVLLVTGFSQRCPLYSLTGIDTCPAQ